MGITDGAYTSLSRALSDPDGADAAEWAQQRSDTKSQLTTGAVMAGVGIVGGVVGNLLINRDAPDEKSDEINLKYEPLKKLRDDTLKLPDNTVGAQCPSDATGTHPNCKCKNAKYVYNINNKTCDLCSGELVADENGTTCVCPEGTTPAENDLCKPIPATVTVQCDPSTPHIKVDITTGECSCTDGYQITDTKTCKCPDNTHTVNNEGLCVRKTSQTSTLTIPESVNLSAESLFDLNKSELKEEAKTALNTFAQSVITTQSNQQNYCITITGHTDRTGNDNINKPLSKRRAKTVGDYLVNKGIPSENIKTSGAGSSHCQKDGNQSDCRKVVVTFDPKQSCSK